MRLKEYEKHYLLWRALGYPKYAELAELLGVSEGTILKESNRHQWRKKKNDDIHDTMSRELGEHNDSEVIDLILRDALGKVSIDKPRDLIDMKNYQRLLENGDEMGFVSLNYENLKIALAISEIQYQGIPDPDLDENTPPKPPVDHKELLKILQSDTKYLECLNVITEGIEKSNKS